MPLLFALAAFAGSPELSPTEIAKRALASTVMIEARDDAGRVVQSGSGVRVGPFLSSDGKVSAGPVLLTAAHVAGASGRLDVVTHDGTRQPVSRIVAWDVGADIALLDVDVAIPALPVHDLAPQAGAFVLVAGEPEGLTGSISTGVVSSFRSTGSYLSLLQHTAPISPGSSGGPVLDTAGRFIGLNSFIVDAGKSQNLNFATSAATISTFMALFAGGMTAISPADLRDAWELRGRHIAGVDLTSSPAEVRWESGKLSSKLLDLPGIVHPLIEGDEYSALNFLFTDSRGSLDLDRATAFAIRDRVDRAIRRAGWPYSGVLPGAAGEAGGRFYRAEDTSLDPAFRTVRIECASGRTCRVSTTVSSGL